MRRQQQHVHLHVFIPVSILSTEERVGVVPVLRIELSGLPELVETMQVWEGNKDDLHKLAFVFTEEEVLNCGINWFGI